MRSFKISKLFHFNAFALQPPYLPPRVGCCPALFLHWTVWNWLQYRCQLHEDIAFEIVWGWKLDEVHLSCWFYDIVRAKMCLSPAVPLCGGQVVSSQPLSCIRLNTKIYLSKMQDVFVLHSGSQLVSSEIQSQPLKSWTRSRHLNLSKEAKRLVWNQNSH